MSTTVNAGVTSTKNKLIGKNYTTPDLYAKVTGKAKYAEDYRADGMLFCKLLAKPLPARAREEHRYESRTRHAGRQGDSHDGRTAASGR